MIIEFFLASTGERVLLNRKPTGLAVLLDGRQAFSFSLTGRLRYAAIDGIAYRRGMNDRVVRIAGGKDLLPIEEGRALLDRIHREMTRVAKEVSPEARDLLRPVFERKESEARRFAAVYGSVPVLPPDQYAAVYLQATVGCAPNRCTFCTLYRDRPFRIRTPEGFAAHLAEVLSLLGPEAEGLRSIFLGEANALAVPFDDLAVMMRSASEALPGRPFACFSDATLHRLKTENQLRELRALGLERVVFGLETAHVPLYGTLRKPGAFGDLFLSLERLRAARISIGLTVLVGLGGREFAERHVAETAEFILRQGLGEGDFVYLSPIDGPGRLLSSGETKMQADAFVERLRKPLIRRGARVAAYDVSSFVYA